MKDNMNSSKNYTSGDSFSNSYTSSASNSTASNSTANGSSCTPNSSIHCTVSNCSNHCQGQDYCGLNTVQIGTHESNPTKTECVACNSFRMK